MKTPSAILPWIGIVTLPSPNVLVSFLPMGEEATCFPDLGQDWAM